MQVIEYYRKRNYGREDLYIKDKEIQLALHLISGRAVLTEHMMEGLKILGFQLREVIAPSLDK